MVKSRRSRATLSAGTDVRAGIPRPRVKVNGTNIATETIQFQSQRPLMDITTGASAQGVYTFAVDPAMTTVTGIPLHYAQYRSRRFVLRYRPSVGVTTSGRIWVAFFNNPETCYKLQNGLITVANMCLLTKYARNMQTFPVHQPFDYNIDPVMRSKMYSNDGTYGSTAEAFARSCHGYLVVFTEGAPHSTTLGTTFLDGSCMLHELNASAYSGVPALRGDADDKMRRYELEDTPTP